MGVIKNILILDSAMSGCMCAVYDLDTQECYREIYEGARGQAEHLVPMAQRVVERAGISFAKVDAIITPLGPGAFTGIRIGMSAAKSFALALGVPLYGVSTLQAVAFGFDGACRVVLETKRADFYVQGFDTRGVAVESPHCALFDGVALDVPVIGDGAGRLCDELGGDVAEVVAGFEVLDPQVIGRAFADDVRREQFFTVDIEPLYLRAPDVSMPKTPSRVLSE